MLWLFLAPPFVDVSNRLNIELCIFKFDSMRYLSYLVFLNHQSASLRSESTSNRANLDLTDDHDGDDGGDKSSSSSSSFPPSAPLKHSLTKPFSCHLCERTFNSKYNVVRHLKQYHAEKRMYKCAQCGRDYKWIDSLHKHMKIHNKEKTEPEQPKFSLYQLREEDEEDEEMSLNDEQIEMEHQEVDKPTVEIEQSAHLSLDLLASNFESQQTFS
jgi:hypothetical protein